MHDSYLNVALALLLVLTIGWFGILLRWRSGGRAFYELSRKNRRSESSNDR